jgi:protein-tyrosine phosphatase
MIDLHSHILPGLDDGATELSVSLAMARLAVADGITHVACTPHIVPGLYDNTTNIIREAVTVLRQALLENEIPLSLVAGADVHVAPDLPEKLAARSVPTLNGSRYFLLEPPHTILPPRLEELALRLINAGFVPIITHPERLAWMTTHYGVIERLNDGGCLMQVTGDSILGGFGRTARLLAERLLDEGRVDIIASDSHGAEWRKPALARARDAVATRVGEEEAIAMVLSRPASILANKDLSPSGLKRRTKAAPIQRPGFFQRYFLGGSS